MKNILLLILSVLLLTSCGDNQKTTIKINEKIPHLDVLVNNMVSNMNTYKSEGDRIVLDSIMDVKEINETDYFVVNKITEVKGTKLSPRFMLLIVSKSNKNEFLLSGQMNVESLKEVNIQMNNLIKYNKWK